MQKKGAIFLSLVFLFLLGSCGINQPEFRGVSNFKTDQINAEKISFNVDVETYNPNGQNIKIRKSKLQLYLNDRYIGEAEMQGKYKMKRKSTTMQNVPVDIFLQKGVLFSLVGVVTGKKIKVRVVGDLKYSIVGIPAKKRIDQTKDFNPKNLGLGDLRGIIGI